MTTIITGIANEDSLAAYVAADMGFLDDLILTYQNAKTKKHIKSFVDSNFFNDNEPDLFELDVTNPERLMAFSEFLKERGHRKNIDGLVHSIAFAPMTALHAPVSECLKEDFLKAMEVSVYSLIELTRIVSPHMGAGGSIVTYTYIGSQRAIENYGIMGVCKAALESTVRYLAAELGQKGIAINAISAPPVQTRAAGGIKDFYKCLENAREKEFIKMDEHLIKEETARLTSFLLSQTAITGQVLYVDGGYSVAG